jgi:hypothetical protein
METAPPNMALLCVPSFSVTSSQNVLPISATPSFSTLRTVIPFDSSPEKITTSRILKKISTSPEIPRKYSIDKIATFLFVTEEANNIEERRKNNGRNKVKEQRNRKFNESQYLGR